MRARVHDPRLGSLLWLVGLGLGACGVVADPLTDELAATGHSGGGATQSSGEGERTALGGSGDDHVGGLEVAPDADTDSSDAAGAGGSAEVEPPLAAGGAGS